MIITITAAEFDRLANLLRQRARLLARAARSARQAGPAAWRRADLLWPAIHALPGADQQEA